MTNMTMTPIRNSSRNGTTYGLVKVAKGTFICRIARPSVSFDNQKFSHFVITAKLYTRTIEHTTYIHPFCRTSSKSFLVELKNLEKNKIGLRIVYDSCEQEPRYGYHTDCSREGYVSLSLSHSLSSVKLFSFSLFIYISCSFDAFNVYD